MGFQADLIPIYANLDMDLILAMFPKSRQEVECILLLGTFVELVDK